jgi:hypothetical protein
MTDSTVDVKLNPRIDEEALLAAVLKIISGHAVVKPGETLVVRVKDWPADAGEDYQEHFDARHRAGEVPFRVVVVMGDELAVSAEQEFALAPANLPGVPTHVVVEAAWEEDGEARREKFGPWLAAPSASHAQVVQVAGSFAAGWCAGKGDPAARVTLAEGGEEIAEGAAYPYPMGKPAAMTETFTYVGS